MRAKYLTRAKYLIGAKHLRGAKNKGTGFIFLPLLKLATHLHVSVNNVWIAWLIELTYNCS